MSNMPYSYRQACLNSGCALAVLHCTLLHRDGSVHTAVRSDDVCHGEDVATTNHVSNSRGAERPHKPHCRRSILRLTRVHLVGSCFIFHVPGTNKSPIKAFTNVASD